MDFIKHIKKGEDKEEITQTYLHSEETQNTSNSRDYNEKSDEPTEHEQ
jgi:hypothetical protein